MDDGISMDAGQLVLDRSWWVLVNRSTKRPLQVEQPTVVQWQLVVPGAKFAYDHRATVLVAGKIFTHALVVDVEGREPPPELAPAGPPSTTPTKTTELSLLV